MKPFMPKTGSVIPPRTGESVPYICQKCGNRFSAKLSVLSALPKKCPECGSILTGRDFTVVN